MSGFLRQCQMAEASAILCNRCNSCPAKVDHKKCETCLNDDRVYQKRKRENEKQNSAVLKKSQLWPNYCNNSLAFPLNAFMFSPTIMFPQNKMGCGPVAPTQNVMHVAPIPLTTRSRDSNTSHDEVLTEDGKIDNWCRIQTLQKEINLLTMKCSGWQSREKLITTTKQVKKTMDAHGVCLLSNFAKADLLGNKLENFLNNLPSNEAETVWDCIFQESNERLQVNNGDKKRLQLCTKQKLRLNKETKTFFDELIKSIGLKLAPTDNSARRISARPQRRCQYVHEANLLLAKQGCEAQAFHADESVPGTYEEKKNYPFSIIVGVSDRAFLDVVLPHDGSPVRVLLCKGDVLFFRGDVTHRGTENPWDRDNYRLHCYVDPTRNDTGDLYKRVENTTIICKSQYPRFKPYQKRVGPTPPLF